MKRKVLSPPKHDNVTPDMAKKAVAAVMAKRDEWISCEDRLPEQEFDLTYSRAVLVYCPGIDCIFSAVHNFDEIEWEYFAVGELSIGDRVTHWQPLPSPPTQD